MAGLEVDRKQLLGVLIITAVLAGGAFWMLWRNKQVVRATAVQTSVDSLTRQLGIAKRDLARGTVEDLRGTIADYEASLRLMRRLVPGGNEVPSLIDDIRGRAGRRNVRIGEFTPLTVESGDPFDTHRYRLLVLGRYDAIGEFLTDIASLPRIMVPVVVTVDTAATATQLAFADTTGALLQVEFRMRTFVKRASPVGETGGPR